MIVFKFYGLEDDMVKTFSYEVHSSIASLCECEEDKILFCACGNTYNHGFEQTDYYLYLEIELCEHYRHLVNFTANLSSYLKKVLANYIVNARIVFKFIDDSDTVDIEDEVLPRFMNDQNVVQLDIDEHEE